MSVLDRGGRIADRATVAALGWTPGTRLRVHIAHTHLTLHAAIDGPLAVKDHRFLWLPAATRHRVDLRPGDRVLLAAEPRRQTLAIYPPAALDELLTHERSASKGGDRDE
ncbi:AbrB/MazE/SpoVT family DNA-binding domain-containing protein [Pseudonocardia sp. DSM 110487]|uniref:AbrB/MazE/SpoVT family DNA-binding domain-containing protein n=1 Tax=Pseudonocardia sp. DSM 110487 TaxID=2865833 RepID=UPI001C69B216|nr:AbrB/MazE/SpoVT family DNA-binding domain-containing protein [Pseudonocardia sp. DSM 110487]QYN33657.1 AbrB/MazE/SpoVT family DNA-binding domain-containing protein [Pseudonocardia sp. DSM 110487]